MTPTPLTPTALAHTPTTRAARVPRVLVATVVAFIATGTLAFAVGGAMMIAEHMHLAM